MKTLSTPKRLNIGDTTLIVIEYNQVESDIHKAGGWLYGFKQTYAIVIRDANGIRAFDIHMTYIELDSLIQKVPELGHLLN